MCVCGSAGYTSMLSVPVCCTRYTRGGFICHRRSEFNISIHCKSFLRGLWEVKVLLLLLLLLPCVERSQTGAETADRYWFFYSSQARPFYLHWVEMSPLRGGSPSGLRSSNISLSFHSAFCSRRGCLLNREWSGSRKWKAGNEKKIKIKTVICPLPPKKTKKKTKKEVLALVPCSCSDSSTRLCRSYVEDFVVKRAEAAW